MSSQNQHDDSIFALDDIWRLILRPMRRFLWLVLFCAVAGSAVGVIYVLQNTVYSSSVSLQVARASTSTLESVTSRISGGMSAGARLGGSQEDSYREKFIGYLNSRDFFEDTASRISTLVNYQAIRRSLRLRRSPRLQAMMEYAGFAPKLDADAPMSVSEMAIRLMEVTAVTKDMTGNGIALTCTTRDQQVAVILANFLGDAAIEFGTRKELREFDQARSYIADRISVIKSTVDELNDKLRDVGGNEIRFEMRGPPRSSELQREIDIARIKIKSNQLMTAKLTAKRDLEDARLLKAQLNGGSLTDEIRSLRQQSEALAFRKKALLLQGIDAASKEVQEIEEELAETNGRIEGRLHQTTKDSGNEELPSSVKAMEETIEKLGRENVTLQAQIEATEAALVRTLVAEQPLPEQRQRYNEILRQIQVQYDLLSDLYRQSYQFDFQRISVQNKIRQVEKAYLGSAQRKPKMQMMILMSLLVGLGLGSSIAILLERRDPTVGTREELSAYGIPLLGAIPNMNHGFFRRAMTRSGAGKRGTGIQALVAANTVPFKYLRTKLLGATGGTNTAAATVNPNRTRLISVHSAAPGEGKTFVTANLAASISLLGKKTLILDADILGSRMAERFNIDPVNGGLVEAIRGDVTLDDAIHREVRPNLDILFSGKRSDDSTELLTSQRFKDLMAELKVRYDFIVIDTAPVNLLPDGLLICDFVDTSLLCVMRSKTRVFALTDAVTTLQSVAGNKIQLLLNFSPMVRVQGAYRYQTARYATGNATPARERGKDSIAS